MIKKKWVVFVAIFLMLGCQGKEHRINVRYSRIGNLQNGNPVFMAENMRIGQVAEIKPIGAERYMVTLSIDSEKKDQITELADFAVVQNPEEKGQNAIAVINSMEGGRMLPDGSVVDGIDLKPPSLLEKIKKEVTQELGQLEIHFDELSRDWNVLIRELQQIPEKQAVKELEKELEILGQEIKESNREWKEKIQKELLPELRKELNRLKEKLREQGQEDEVKPLEIKMDELQTI